MKNEGQFRVNNTHSARLQIVRVAAHCCRSNAAQHPLVRALTSRSLQDVRTAALGRKRPSCLLRSRSVLSALLPFVAGAANDWIEPNLPNAAPRSNGSNARQTGRSVSAR
jgi:hypothetical protein